MTIRNTKSTMVGTSSPIGMRRGAFLPGLALCAQIGLATAATAQAPPDAPTPLPQGPAVGQSATALAESLPKQRQADAIGLTPGEILRNYNDTPLGDAVQLVAPTGGINEDQPVTLQLRRLGQPIRAAINGGQMGTAIKGTGDLHALDTPVQRDLLRNGARILRHLDRADLAARTHTAAQHPDEGPNPERAPLLSQKVERISAATAMSVAIAKAAQGDMKSSEPIPPGSVEHDRAPTIASNHDPEGCRMLPPTIAARDSRLAFVLGNGIYEPPLSALPNPVSDAKAIADILRDLGFGVILVTDAHRNSIIECLEYVEKVLLSARHKLGVFYFSGHAVQIADDNYIAAIDVRELSAKEPGFMPLALFAEPFVANSDSTVIILDACRTTPFGSSGLSPTPALWTSRFVTEDTATRDGASRMGYPVISEGRQLNPSVFVAYATSPNAVAFDGEGRHSPFADGLIRHLSTRGRSLDSVMVDVREYVGRKTNWMQVPWTRSSVRRPIFLNGQLTLDQIRAESDRRASQSTDLLAVGDRPGALKAALSAFPPNPSPEDFALLRQAHVALYRAYVSRNVRIDVENPVDGVFNRDGSRLVTSGRTSFSVHLEPIRLWDAVTGDYIRTLAPPSSDRGGYPVGWPFFSRSGSLLALVSERAGTLTVWDSQTGREVFRSGYGRERKCSYSSRFGFFGNDKKVYVLCDSDHRLWVYDLLAHGDSGQLYSGTYVTAFPLSENSLAGVSVPNDDCLKRYTGCEHYLERLDSESGKPTEARYLGSSKFPLGVFTHVSPSGNIVLIGSMDAVDPQHNRAYIVYTPDLSIGVTQIDAGSVGANDGPLLVSYDDRLLALGSSTDDRISYHSLFPDRIGKGITLSEFEEVAEWGIFDKAGRHTGFAKYGVEAWKPAPTGKKLYDRAKDALGAHGVSLTLDEFLDLGL
jgi:WD40 repeat protein